MHAVVIDDDLPINLKTRTIIRREGEVVVPGFGHVQLTIEDQGKLVSALGDSNINGATGNVVGCLGREFLEIG